MSFIVGLLIGAVIGFSFASYTVAECLKTNNNLSDIIIRALKKNGVIKD